MTPLRVAIVGCGKIGAIRAGVASAHPGSRVVAVADLDATRAAQLAQATGSAAAPSWESILERPDVDAVVVATTHDHLAVVAAAALDRGKHVLCEKPMSTSVDRARTVLDSARRSKGICRIGFNHRYHPAIRRARRLAADGALGALMFLRCRYGHGGRPGYEQEWRMDPARSGGGEMLDQGIHAVDLFRCFLGDLSEVSGMTATWAWAVPVEDNAFCLFRSPSGHVASLHASWTQWKNTFSFEVFGDRGAAIVSGLGGSYGVEQLTVQRRREGGGVPHEEITEFPGVDESWALEWADFIGAIEGRPSEAATAADGVAALAAVAAVYESARSRSITRIADVAQGAPV